MRTTNKSTSKIDVEFEFLEIRIGIAFPCKISLKVNTNYAHGQTAPVEFDNAHHQALLNSTLKTTIVIHSSKENLIDILPIIHTDSGQKYAGKIKFDVQKAIQTCLYSQTLFIEQCPDKTATLSFRFNYSNVRESAPDQLHGTQNNQNNSMSFYTSFNQVIEHAMGHRDSKNEGFNRITRARSRSPNILNLKPQSQLSRLPQTQETVFVFDDADTNANVNENKENSKNKQSIGLESDTSSKRNSVFSERNKRNSNVIISSPGIGSQEKMLQSGSLNHDRVEFNESPNARSRIEPFVSADPENKRLDVREIDHQSSGGNQFELIKTVNVRYDIDANNNFDGQNPINNPLVQSETSLKDSELASKIEIMTKELVIKTKMLNTVSQEMADRTNEVNKLKEFLQSLQSQHRKSEQNFRDSYEEIISQNEQLKRKLESNLIKPEESRIQALEAELREKSSLIRNLEHELSSLDDKRTELKKRLYESETAWVTERQTFEETIKELEGRIFQLEAKEDFGKLQLTDDLKICQDKIKALQELVQLEKHRANFLNEKFETHNQAYLALEKSLGVEKLRNQQVLSENDLLRQDTKSMLEEIEKLTDELAAVNERKNADLLQIEEEKQRFMQEIYELKVLIKDIIEEKQKLLGNDDNVIDNHFENQLQSIKDSVNFSDLQDNELKRLNEVINDLRDTLRAKEDEFKIHCVTIQRLHAQQVEALEREVKNLQTDLENSKASSDSATEQLNSAFTRIDILIKENYESGQSLLLLKEENEKFKGELSEVADDRKALIKDIDSLKADIEDLKKKLDEVTKEKENAIEEFEGQKYENEVLIEEAEASEKAIKKERAEVDSLNTELNRISLLAKHLQNDKEEIKEQADHWKEIATKLGKDLAMTNTANQAARQAQSSLVLQLKNDKTRLANINSIWKVSREHSQSQMKSLILENYYQQLKLHTVENILMEKISYFENERSRLINEHDRFSSEQAQNFEEAATLVQEKEKLIHQKVHGSNNSNDNLEEHLALIADAYYYAKGLEALSSFRNWENEIFCERLTETHELYNKVENDKQQLELQIIDMKEFLYKTENSLSSIVEENVLLKQEISDWKLIMDAKEGVIVALNDQMQQKMLEIEALQLENHEQSLIVLGQNEELIKIQSQVTALTNDLSESQIQTKNLEIARLQLEESDLTTHQQVESFRSANIELKSQIEIYGQNLTDMNNDFNKLQNEIEYIKSENTNKDHKIFKAKSFMICLDQKIFQIQSAFIKAIEKLSESFTISHEKIINLASLVDFLNELRATLESKIQDNVQLMEQVANLEKENQLIINEKTIAIKESVDLKKNIVLLEGQLKSLLNGTKTSEETQKEVILGLEIQLKTANNTICQLKDQIQSLEVQVKAMMLNETGTKNHFQLEKEHFQKQIYDQNNVLTRQREDIESFKNKISTYESLIKTEEFEKKMLEQDIVLMKEKSADLEIMIDREKTNVESITSELDLLKIAQTGLNNDIAVLKIENISLAEKNNILVEAQNKLKESNEVFEEKCKFLSNECKAKDAQIFKLLDDLENKSQLCVELNDQKNHSKEIELQLQQTLDLELKEKVTLVKDIQSLSDQINILAKEIRLKEDEFSSLNTKYEESIQIIDSKEKELKNLHEQIGFLQNNVSELQKTEETSRKQLESLDNLLLSKQVEIEELVDRTSKIEIKLVDEENHKKSLLEKINDAKHDNEISEAQLKELQEQQEISKSSEKIMSDNIIDLLDRLGKVEALLISKNSEKTNLSNQIEQLLKNLDHKEATIQAASTKLQEVEKSRDQLETSIIEISHINDTKIKECTKEIENLTKSLSETSIALESSRKEKHELETKVSELTKANHNYSIQIESMDTKQTHLEIEIGRVQNESNLFKSELEAAIVQKEKLSLILTKLKEKQATLKLKLEDSDKFNADRSQLLENSKLENAALSKDIELLQKDLKNSKEKLTLIETLEVGLKAEITKLKIERDEHLRRIESVHSETKALMTQTQEKEQDRTLLRIDFEKLETENKMLKEFTEQKDKEMTILRNDLVKLQEQNLEINKQLIEKSKEIDAKEIIIAQKFAEEQKLKAKIEKGKMEIQGLVSQVELLQNDKSELTSSQKHQANELKSHKEMLNARETELKNLNQRLEEASLIHKKEVETKEGLIKEISDLNSTIVLNQSEITEMNKHVNRLLESQNNSEKERYSSQEQIHNMSNQFAVLAAEKEKVV